MAMAKERKRAERVFLPRPYSQKARTLERRMKLLIWPLARLYLMGKNVRRRRGMARRADRGLRRRRSERMSAAKEDIFQIEPACE